MQTERHTPRFETHMQLIENTSELEGYFRQQTLRRGQSLNLLEQSPLQPEQYQIAKERYLTFTTAQAYIIGNRLRTLDKLPKTEDYQQKTRQLILSSLRFIRPFTETQRANRGARLQSLN